MYQSDEFIDDTGSPTLAQLMMQRGLDPFNNDDCIAFGKSIAKFTYNIPDDDFNELLLAFVTRYQMERISSNTLMEWMLNLRSYGIDRQGWYEDTYDVFRGIDKFAFLGRKVERDTNESREKEQQGTRGVTRNEDEDNESTINRDVNENGSILNTRTQDDVLTGARNTSNTQNRETEQESSETDARNTEEDTDTVNVGVTNATANNVTTTDEHKTGDNRTQTDKTFQNNGNTSGTETGTVTHEGNTSGLTTTTINESVADTIDEKTDTTKKTTTDRTTTEDGSDVTAGVTGVVDVSNTTSKTTDVLTIDQTDQNNITEDITENTTGQNDNTQNTLKKNATGIGTATDPIGSGTFGSHAPSSGVVKDSTFEEGQTTDSGTKSEDTTREAITDNKTTRTGSDTKVVDVVADENKSVDTTTDNTLTVNRTGTEIGEVTDTQDTQKTGNNTSSKDGTHTVNANEDTTSTDTSDKTTSGNTSENGEDNTDQQITIDETVIGSQQENKDETTKTGSQETGQRTTTDTGNKTGTQHTTEDTTGNTVENVDDARKVDEEANETRSNSTDMNEELFRKLRKMVEENENREDLSKESNAGTMIETTTGEVVPMMELARRYYDLRVSAKSRWVTDARKLFRTDYNF